MALSFQTTYLQMDHRNIGYPAFRVAVPYRRRGRTRDAAADYTQRSAMQWRTDTGGRA